MSYGRRVGLSALLLSLCLLGRPEAYSRAGGPVIAIMNLIRDGTSLNDADQQRQVRGYYEDLTHVERFDARLAQVYGLAPDDRWLQAGGQVRRRTNDFREMELMPSVHLIAKGAPFRTNRWGIRDRDYEQKPRPGTCRMVLMGQSPSVGGGVHDDQIFEALLEDRLNREKPLPDRAYEILNFAQPAYTLLDQLAWIESSRLFEFEPAMLLYVAHPTELERAFDKLAWAIHENVPIPFPNLRQMTASVGLKPGADGEEVRLRMQPMGASILRWAYEQIAAQSRMHHVRVVWIFLPAVPRRVGDEAPAMVRDQLFSAAREAGFQIVDLSDVWQRRDQKTLAQAPWDDHPNAFAHGLIAERLYQRLPEVEGCF